MKWQMTGIYTVEFYIVKYAVGLPIVVGCRGLVVFHTTMMSLAVAPVFDVLT